ncbi:uncharacterized protein LOC133895545 isoform X2 [Phragmites australis]|uniref:uncharacterized protein LOC133895545 isoform X2 n=1 Tax=Phragmites australis TaxID=29695 RepID=UPI002D78EB5D|nr:uncharacterized protein LOC133895545 isoform X2 [Phragmites australis]
MAAAAADEEGILEVRCAGCGETLEVERGLTEFACPGCATPQALPPELMPPPPPPPRPRRALPLGAGPGAAPWRVPCGGCGAVLAVPRGLRRFLACPLCGAEVTIDGGGRLASHIGVHVVSPPGAVALAATSSQLPEEEPISRAIRLEQVQVGRYNKPIHLEQTGGPFPARSFREESISSLRSNTRTAVHVDWAKGAPVNQSVHREEPRIKLLNVTVDRYDFRKKSRPLAGPGFVCVDKVRVEHPSNVSHAPRAQGPSNHSVHTEEAHGENESGTIGRIGIRKASHAAISNIAEQKTLEPKSQSACAEHMEVDSCGNSTRWNQKRKRSSRTTAGGHEGEKGSLCSSNKEIHLTCSKNTQPEGISNRNPIQEPGPSPNENQFDAIDRIITSLCPSALPQKQVSQARSNDLDNIDATLPPVSINHDTSQGDCFPHGYRQYQAVATGSLFNQGFSSAQEHEIPQESSNGIDSHEKSSPQVRPNSSLGILHKQHIQEYPSHDSQSEQAQVGTHHNKIVKHYKNTANGSMYSLNEGDYIGEQPHNGADQQVTLVTASSNPTTSPPLLTATPLLITTPSSVVTRPLVQQPPQYYQSSDTLHSQGAQAVGIGSIDRSSKKRRGRGPTKLIEPRREADRPVLTPNNADTWDVNPPCPKVASTISALLKQWHPGSAYVPANQHTNEVHQEQLILHWHQYHSDTRAIIMDEFLQRYKWAPGQEELCLKLFDRKVVRQFTGLLCDEKRRARVELAASRKAKEALDAARSKQTNLDVEDAGEEMKQRRRDPAAVGHEYDNPLQWKPFPPEWMQPKWWEMLCEHWASEEVLQVSAQKRKNRYTGGSAQHTAGSRSIAMHRKLMIIENGGKPVSDIEVFNKTHKRDGGKGEFVTEKAKKTVESVKRRLEAGDTELDPHLVWAQEVGGRNRGCLDKETQKEMFTQDQVQEMISHAMQQLNETWEKRFQSLEQRMHGMVSLEAPQHGPWRCAARPVAEEGQASHQDASDSSHEGIHQSATDDDED